MRVHGRIRGLGIQLRAAVFRPIDLPWLHQLPLDDELSQRDRTTCAGCAPPDWAVRNLRKRRLIVLIGGLVLVDVLIFAGIYAFLTWSTDAVFLHAPTTLVALGCSLVLLHCAWAWASKPSAAIAKSAPPRRRVSDRTLIVIVAAIALASSLMIRSQELRNRARYYAGMEARCRSAAIRPILGSAPTDIEQLAKDYAGLKEQYAIAAWHPLISVEHQTEEMDAKVAERAPALFQLENQAVRWAGFNAEVRRRLASRGRQLDRVTGPHVVRDYVLCIAEDDTFNFWQRGQHAGRYFGTGFAELVDGNLQLDFVDGGVQPGSRGALALKQAVARIEELIKLRALDEAKK